MKGKRLNPGTEFKKGHTFWLGKKRPDMIGHKWNIGRPTWNKGLEGYKAAEQHWNWKGGITPIRKKLRETYAHRKWRKEVFERDGYTCQHCGIKKNLEVDHIKRWKEYPELRYELTNGRTLCRPCHMKTDTYGNKQQVAQTKNN